MPFTYAPTATPVNTNTTQVRARAGSESVAFDNTGTFSLSPPASANHAECYAWAGMVGSLDPSVAPDSATQRGYLISAGPFELEGEDDLNGFRFKGLSATTSNLEVTYYTLPNTYANA